MKSSNTLPFLVVIGKKLLTPHLFDICGLFFVYLFTQKNNSNYLKKLTGTGSIRKLCIFSPCAQIRQWPHKLSFLFACLSCTLSAAAVSRFAVLTIDFGREAISQTKYKYVFQNYIFFLQPCSWSSSSFSRWSLASRPSASLSAWASTWGPGSSTCGGFRQFSRYFSISLKTFFKHFYTPK